MSKVEWTIKAVKQVRHIPAKDKLAISDAVDTLESWPQVANVKKLQGRSDYRLRVGRYRVIFTINPQGAVTIILIEEVKKRDERTY